MTELASVISIILVEAGSINLQYVDPDNQFQLSIHSRDVAHTPKILLLLLLLYPETREHFLTSCESLNNIKTVYINKIRSLFEHSSSDINILLDDPASCTQLLSDASHPDIDNTLHLNSDQTRQLELFSREHLERTKISSVN